MEIISNKETVNTSIEVVFNFLSNMNNYQQLMPEQVTEWTSEVDECRYVLNGMAQIGMKISEKIAYEKIIIHSHGKVPFAFTLNVEISENTTGTSDVQLIFNGDVNLFMKPMLEKPLTNFFNFIVQRVNQKYIQAN